MSTLKFNDGVEFNLTGELRCEQRCDGWYVVGQGLLIPVVSEEKGWAMIDELNVTS